MSLKSYSVFQGLVQCLPQALWLKLVQSIALTMRLNWLNTQVCIGLNTNQEIIKKKTRQCQNQEIGINPITKFKLPTNKATKFLNIKTITQKKKIKNQNNKKTKPPPKQKQNYSTR